MEESKKHFYAKFEMDSERDVMKNLLISESRSTIDKWKAVPSEERKSGDDEKQKELEQLNPFQKVGRDFESSIDAFQQTVPFIMHTLPVMRRFYDDKNIRRFVAKHGEKLETGEFELYRVSLDHFGSVVRMLQDSSAIGSGINRIPGLFMIGLVSAYDQFLSQLNRPGFAGGCLF